MITKEQIKKWMETHEEAGVILGTWDVAYREGAKDFCNYTSCNEPGAEDMLINALEQFLYSVKENLIEEVKNGSDKS